MLLSVVLAVIVSDDAGGAVTFLCWVGELGGTYRIEHDVMYSCSWFWACEDFCL